VIRVGLIGYGYWGPNLARNIAETPGLSLVAVADARPERLKLVQQRYGAALALADAATLLARDDIYAVVIATPLSTHAPLARAALERRKHVLLEKPLASTVRDAEMLGELADRHDLRLMVDHTFVYTGAVQKIRQLIDSGELGELLYLDSVRVNLGLFQYDTNVIWDLAPHDLSIMDHLIAQRPVAVSADGGRVATFEHESIAYITVHFDNGFLGHFHVNWLAPVKIRKMLLGGRRRMLTFDDLEPSEKVKVYDHGVDFETGDDEARRALLVSYRMGDMHAPKLERQEALTGVTREFAAAIDGKREPLTGAAAGIRVVRLLEAAEKSLRSEGRRIQI
jgi:predicted dehydrogenase